MQTDTTTPVPFSTQDATLAFCLYIAGAVEWRPPTNTFDREILFTAGGGKKSPTGEITRASRFADMTFEEAATQAWEEGLRGEVQYWFEKSPELPHFLKAYSEQQAEIKDEANDRDGGDRLREIMRLAAGELKDDEKRMDERIALLRIACVTLKGRGEFVNRWKGTIPLLRVRDKGTVRREGGAEKHPGFKLYPLDATPEMKRKIGV